MAHRLQGMISKYELAQIPGLHAGASAMMQI
jgi:hypothetical protein